MFTDAWKCTDERDAEPQPIEVECEECGGSGRLSVCIRMGCYCPMKCECCNGTGHVMVMER